MFPIIYPNDETAFLTLGYGMLADCISCAVTEELNGAYTLELKYPNSGINAEYLQPRNIIVCKPNWSEDREAFRIYKVTRAIKNSITVYANQLSYDLSGFVVLPGTSTSLAAAITKLSNAATGFTISTTKSSSTDFIVDVPSSVRSWFGGQEGSLIDLYGGEWKYSFWTCQLLASRGADNGLRISYGVNLAEYQKELDDNKYSKVMAYFSKEIDNVKTVVYGTAVSTGASGTDRTLILDATSNWNDTVPTAADLTTYATNYISSHSSALKNHKQTITITPEVLATQEISMGDTVHVIYDDEIVSTRVIKTVFDALGEKYTTVELGSKKTSIAETIKSLNEDISTPSQMNYLPLGGGTMVGDITMSNSSDIYLDSSASTIEQKLTDSANYGTAIRWNKTTPYTENFKPSIGFYNVGNAICVLPHETASNPWGGTVGLFLKYDTTPYIKYENNYVGRFTATPTSGRILTSDDTLGGMVSSAYSFTESTATVSLSLGGGTATITARKRGNIVQFNPAITNSSKFASATSGDTIGTLPSGFRPTEQKYFMIGMRNNSTWASATYYPVYIQIATTGVMKIYGNTTNIRACTNIIGEICFAI